MSEEYFAVLKQEVEGLKIGKLYSINGFYRDESGKAIMINIYNDNMDFVRKSKIDCIERYRMLKVRAVCDK